VKKEEEAKHFAVVVRYKYPHTSTTKFPPSSPLSSPPHFHTLRKHPKHFISTDETLDCKVEKSYPGNNCLKSDLSNGGGEDDSQA
jgi:hypothetical protein